MILKFRSLDAPHLQVKLKVNWLLVFVWIKPRSLFSWWFSVPIELKVELAEMVTCRVVWLATRCWGTWAARWAGRARATRWAARGLRARGTLRTSRCSSSFPSGHNTVTKTNTMLWIAQVYNIITILITIIIWLLYYYKTWYSDATVTCLCLY